MRHYFVPDAEAAADTRELRVTFDNRPFVFTTQGGLFSYTEIDYASRLLVENLPTLSSRVLDLGCGYGFIGVVLAARGLNVTMYDINPAAVDCARQNAARNGVQACCVVSDGFSAPGEDFNAVVTNPPIHAGKETVFRLYTEARARLTPRGSLFCVVQKKHGADSHIKKMRELFTECLILYKRKGYYVLQGNM